jgi:predicted metal-binding protein
MNSEFSTPPGSEHDNVICRLIERALEMGAGRAAAIDPSEISVEEELAARCHTPRCENYGLSPSCPPHVGGPEEFKVLAEKMDIAVLFTIDLPSEILLSSQRQDAGKYLHEIAYEMQKTALSLGAAEVRGFAGGSCKKIFCGSHKSCNVVNNKGPCRNPGRAMPSMSGYGINVKKMLGSAGLTLWVAADRDNEEKPSMGSLAGLVLVRF